MHNILAWIVLGAAVGIVINLIDEKPSIGTFLVTMILSILGALLGGFLSNLFLDIGIGGFNITSLMIAVFGAILALFVRRTFGSI